MTETVKVMVRCRPMNRREKQLNCQSVVNIDSKLNQVNLFKQGSKEVPKPFTFDHVFGADSAQSYIYEQTAFSLVDSVIEGYNGTIFAYGQTGCGKTHTMMGTTETEQSRGIIPRTFSQIINFTSSDTEKKHLVQCSFMEIYNEEIHDLLGKNYKDKMELKESPDKGVFVKGLTMNIVKSTIEMEKFMDIGFKNRAVRETAMNKESSRSHSLFTIYIQSEEIDELGKEKFKAGKLNLVDLAGSQRQSKTHATGDGMKEAAKINLSLSALGNVISALVDGKTQHIPYRDSKLTRLLQDSLGGNTKTIMIAAISPASDNYQETLSSLRYASRAKFIQNKPIINEDPKDTLLRQYADEIKKLKDMLEGKIPTGGYQQPGVIMQQMPGQTEIRYIQGQGNGEQAQQWKNELQSKQQRLKMEKQQKQKLKVQLQNLQNLISTDKTQTDNKELERMKKLKQKLKNQKKKEQEWRLEKKKRDDELLTMEKSYKSLNEEVEEMRVRFQEIKKKYVGNLQEINDIREEAEREKEELLDTIRMQQSQINKFSGICSMLLTQDQIEQIIQQSEYNDETRQWLIAPFYYRERTVNFPKLGSVKNTELIEHEKEKKQLVFRELTRKEQIGKLKGSYRISDVVRGARQYDFDLSNNSGINNNYPPNTKKQKSQNAASTQIKNNHNLQTLIPIKMQSERNLRNDEELHSTYSMTHINGMGSNSNVNKLKLNPINVNQSKKQTINNKADVDWNGKIPL